MFANCTVHIVVRMLIFLYDTWYESRLVDRWMDSYISFTLCSFACNSILRNKMIKFVFTVHCVPMIYFAWSLHLNINFYLFHCFCHFERAFWSKFYFKIHAKLRERQNLLILRVYYTDIKDKTLSTNQDRLIYISREYSFFLPFLFSIKQTPFRTSRFKLCFFLYIYKIFCKRKRPVLLFKHVVFHIWLSRVICACMQKKMITKTQAFCCS